MAKKLTMLMVLDGFGLTDETEGNAVNFAKKPNLDKIMAENFCEKGYASGLDVGLPDGQMGNSEVGHLNIGAGRIVYQELTRISKSITDGDFFTNTELLAAVKNAKENNTAIHFFGLLSTGGVHSHTEHLYALLKLAKENELEKVFVHAFLDGRDTAPSSGRGFIEELEAKIKEIGVGKIATVSGRYYAMDRDNRWERVELAYNALVQGKGAQADSALDCIDKSYASETLDEFVLPTIIMNNDMPTATIKENDSVVFFNFRPDRAREITRAFCEPDFDGFIRANGFLKLHYTCFTQYDITIPNTFVAYKPVHLTNTLGEYIATKGYTQLRTAETEKYAHVTFFFNGGVEKANVGEDRVLVASPKVPTYDLQPEMSAFELTDKLVENMKSGKYDLIVVNYANPDMVGHTGIFDAAVKAVEAVDTCVGKVYETLKEIEGQMFICADHGNVDKLIDYVSKEAFTAHTTNPVPFILVSKEAKGIMADGKLCDIAPTLLDMMDIEKPEEMTGHSLLIK